MKHVPDVTGRSAPTNDPAHAEPQSPESAPDSMRRTASRFRPLDHAGFVPSTGDATVIFLGGPLQHEQLDDPAREAEFGQRLEATPATSDTSQMPQRGALDQARLVSWLANIDSTLNLILDILSDLDSRIAAAVEKATPAAAVPDWWPSTTAERGRPAGSFTSDGTGCEGPGPRGAPHDR